MKRRYSYKMDCSFIIPAKSNVIERGKRFTPNKRITQAQFVKTIQKVSGSERPEGDWIHTAGPGCIAISYLVFERAFHAKTTYIVSEWNKDLSQKMHSETYLFRNRLERHQYSNKVLFRRGELFKQVEFEIKKHHRRFIHIDADFCTLPHSLINAGLLDGIANTATLQAEIQKGFFLSLTYCMRKSDKRDYKAIEEIDSTVEAFGGQPVDFASYNDGAPMQSILWYF